MKKPVTIFLLLLFSAVFGQHTFNYFKIDTLTSGNYTALKNESFYNTTEVSELLFYIKNSDKKYKLLYTFTDWCKPCREKHPTVLSLGKEFENLEVLFLTNIFSGRNFLSTEAYLKSIGNSSPIFSLGYNEKMKNSKGKYEYLLYNKVKKKNVKVDRYDYYIQNLVPGHQYYGYGLMILYDQNNRVVYASTYKETDEQVFSEIRRIISN